MNQANRMLAVDTAIHFCVDYACFYVLFHTVARSFGSGEQTALAFLLYNVLAFGLQPIAGFWGDWKPRVPVGLIGCILVLTGVGLVGLPWMALLFCAAGNALYHTAGGRRTLCGAKGKLAPGGIFVSSGALGVAFGTMAGSDQRNLLFIPAMLLLLSLLFLIRFFAPQNRQGPVCFACAAELPLGLLLGAALLSAAIRAFVGGIVPLDWNAGTYAGVLIGIAACAGKVLGGLLSDRIGARNTAVGAAALAVPLLCFGTHMELTSLAGILLLNCTMPITLGVLAARFPNNPGLAFGLNSLALLCGTVLLYFMHFGTQTALVLVAVLLFISVACVVLTTRNRAACPDERRLFW